MTAVLVVLAGAAARAQSGDADRGRRLFTGAAPFAYGGPACAACHDTAALARPGGGTMGPDLTDLAARIGPQGVAAALNTLYFPTMTPLFRAHPLTTQEQQALAAFVEGTPRRGTSSAVDTLSMGAASLVGGAILLAITGWLGRNRLRSVRRSLLARADAARGSAS